MKVLIITPGVYPVPSVKGGAVSTLIDYILKENEKQQKINLSIISTFNKKALKLSSNFNHSKIIFSKLPFFLQLIDYLLYLFAKFILRKKKTLSYRYFFHRLWMVHTSKSILKKYDFDKVIIENSPILFKIFKNKNILKRYDGKYFFHLHNIVRKDFGTKSFILKSKRVLCISDYICNWFKSRYQEYPSDRIVKWANVCDLNLFRIDSADSRILEVRNKYNLDNYKLVLFAGRLDAEKGALELLKAFEKLKNDSYKLLIVGSYCYNAKISNAYEKEVYQYASSIKNVLFTGFIDFKDMPIFYKIADVVVLPSIWDEPAGLTIIEALSAGAALITTNSGGIPEYASGASIIIERDEKLIDNLSYNIDLLLNDSKMNMELRNKALNKTKDWNLEKYYYDFINVIK